MICFPSCKINLGLRITQKRADGFHALETVFYPVGLQDIVEVVPAKLFAFSHTGISIPGDVSNNLCVKAYHLLKADFPEMGDVKIHLHKNIPIEKS